MHPRKVRSILDIRRNVTDLGFHLDNFGTVSLETIKRQLEGALQVVRRCLPLGKRVTEVTSVKDNSLLSLLNEVGSDRVPAQSTATRNQERLGSALFSR